jgi:hypothetical protein
MSVSCPHACSHCLRMVGVAFHDAISNRGSIRLDSARFGHPAPGLGAKRSCHSRVSAPDA